MRNFEQEIEKENLERLILKETFWTRSFESKILNEKFESGVDMRRCCVHLVINRRALCYCQLDKRSRRRYCCSNMAASARLSSG